MVHNVGDKEYGEGIHQWTLWNDPEFENIHFCCKFSPKDMYRGDISILYR